MRPSPSEANYRQQQAQSAQRLVQIIKRSQLEIGDQYPDRDLIKHKPCSNPVKEPCRTRVTVPLMFDCFSHCHGSSPDIRATTFWRFEENPDPADCSTDLYHGSASRISAELLRVGGDH